MVYRFEDYEFDQASFRFSQDGVPVALEPKALHLLLYLLENRNRLLRKQELLDCVWQEASVTDNALTRAIGLLRKALNDDSRTPRFIETVPTLGYRFIAAVTVEGEPAPANELDVLPEAVPFLPAEPLPPQGEFSSGTIGAISLDSPLPAPTAAPSSSLFGRRKFLWTAGAAAVAGTGVWLAHSRRSRTFAPAIHVVVQLIDGSVAADPGQRLGSPVLAPDGSAMIVPLRTATGSYLFLRRLDSDQMTRLEGTRDAGYPFWSPDSHHIGFFADAKLKRMPVSGGSVIVVCEVAETRGGAWSSRGVILFGPNLHALSKVAGSGGTPEEVTQLDKAAGENSHRYPIFLPDGNRFLYFARTDDVDKRGIFLESLDRKQARRRVLVADGQFFALGLVPESSRYYLITQQSGRIVAQSFNVDSGEISGVPQTLLDRPGQVSVSDTGVLVLRSVDVAEPLKLTWRDRAGHETGALGAVPGCYSVALSPGGRFAAAVSHDSFSGLFGILTAALPSGQFEPITALQHFKTIAWSPDGGTLYYGDSRQKMWYRRRVDPRGPEEPLRPNDGEDYIRDVSPDGRFLLGERTPDNKHATLIWAPSDAPEWHVTDVTGDIGMLPTFSPDGRWIAFASDRTGKTEVYLMDFPTGSRIRRISVDGGRMPRWRRDGNELFFVADDQRMTSASLSGPDKTVGPVRPLFATSLRSRVAHPLYDVTGDGQRFLLIEAEKEAGRGSIEMILNWPSLLPR